MPSRASQTQGMDTEREPPMHIIPPDASGASDPLLNVVVDDRYRIERRLGIGGMSTVYLAKNGAGGRVAIKLIPPRLVGTKNVRQRCMLEARVLTEIASNYVVRAFDAKELPNGQIYIVMEFLNGEDLETLVHREGPLPWRRAVRMVRMICAGLSAAHGHNLVHRDVKLPNCFRVLVDGDPDHIKLIDFGIVKVINVVEASGAMKPITEEGVILGTVHYLAPELFHGGAPSVQSDLYAVGISLYKLLIGEVPFPGTNKLDVCQRHCSEPVVPPGHRMPALEIPADVDRLVLRALAKDPEHRYQTADEMVTDLDALLNRSYTPGRIAIAGFPRLVESGDAQAAKSPGDQSAENTDDPAAQVPVKANPPDLLPRPITTTDESRVQSGPRCQPTPVRVVGRRERLFKLFTPLLCTVVALVISWAVVPEVPARQAEVSRSAPPQSVVKLPEVGAGEPPAIGVPRLVDPTIVGAADTEEIEIEDPATPLDLPAAPALDGLEPTSPDSGGSPLDVKPPEPVAAVVPLTGPVLPAADPPRTCKPEPNFDYASAQKYIQEQAPYISRCLADAKLNAAVITVVAQRSGVSRSVQTNKLARAASKCLRSMIKQIVFEASPAGGAFVYHYPGATLSRISLPGCIPPPGAA
jgi:serine/threonine protein kinase